MCLAIPGRVMEIYHEDRVRMAKVDFGGVIRKACVEYMPEIQVGDYAIVHVGIAISRLDREEAERIFLYLQEMEATE